MYMFNFQLTECTRKTNKTTCRSSVHHLHYMCNGLFTW